MTMTTILDGMVMRDPPDNERDWIMLKPAKRKFGSRTPKGQAKARLKVCQDTVAAGGSMSDAAATLDMSPSTLWRWLDTHHPDVLEKLANVGRYKRTNRVPRIEKIRRLRVAVHCTKSECARRWRMTNAGAGQWLKTHAPDGPEAALEAMGVVV